MARRGYRGAVLEMAVLGLLHETPMHGYELRKRLNVVLGSLRALSYGTLYPALRGLVDDGLIAPDPAAGPPRTAVAGSKRARIVYRLTPRGRDRFQALVNESGPTAWEDDTFDVRFAFFARTEAQVRLRVLEGRRARVEERLAGFRMAAGRHTGASRTAPPPVRSTASTTSTTSSAPPAFPGPPVPPVPLVSPADPYTAELHRHGVESAEREVRWLTELIEAEYRRLQELPEARHTPRVQD